MSNHLRARQRPQRRTRGGPRGKIEDGGKSMGTKGRKNVKKPKKQVLEKKAQKAAQDKK